MKRDRPRVIIRLAFRPVPEMPAPLHACVAHTLAPGESSRSATKPRSGVATGWSPVAIISRPSKRDRRNTCACLCVWTDETTRRGPTRVATVSPATTCAIAFQDPSAIRTGVSPTRHHAPSCCGPRRRSGSSAE
jgi:hypothetical protein